MFSDNKIPVSGHTAPSFCVGLLVEDQYERGQLANHVRAAGYRLIVAETGTNIAQALANADMILVDEASLVRYSDDLAAVKRSALPDFLPLLLLSDPGADTDSRLGQGMDDVLVRPVSEPQLQARVRLYAHLHEQSRVAWLESERRFSQTFDLAPSGIARTSLDGRFMMVNRRLCEMLGYEEAEFLTLFATDVTHTDSTQAMFRARKDLLTGASQIVHGERKFVRRNGEILWTEIWAKLARDQDGKPEYYITIFNDISERKRIEQELGRVVRAREVMAECNSVLVHANQENKLLQQMCEIVVSRGSYRSAWIGIVDQDNPELLRIAACGGKDCNWLLGETPGEPESICFRRLGPMAGTVLNRRPVVINQIFPATGSGPWWEQARLAGVGSVITFPLVYEGSCYGALAIHANEINVFSRDEIDLLSELTDDIAFGINSLRNRAIRHATEQSLRESERFAHATIDALRKHICVIDEEGRIIAVNKAWRQFGSRDAGFYAGIVLEGDNYLAMCDAAAREGVPEANDIAQAIRKIIKKEEETYAIEYPGVFDGEEYWFLLRISRFPGDGPVRLVISRDPITERRQAEEALRRSQERLGFLLSATPAVIYAARAETPYGVTFISDNILTQFGYLPGEFTASDDFWLNLIHPEDKPKVLASLQQDDAGPDKSIEYRIRYKDGHYGWVRDQSQLVASRSSSKGELVGYMIDIDEKKRFEERLLQLAHYDELTRLPNRVLFQDRLHQAMAQARRNDWSLAIMFIDLDRFKLVNDTLGHLVGDELLRKVSSRLSQCVRADDTIGRLGGDEFALILSALNSPGDARLVAEKIMKVFAEPFEVENREIYISPSIGITVYPADAENQEHLIKNADTAMYRAKEIGRNNYQFYRPEMNRDAHERFELETSLRRALDRNEFRLYFQPKVNLHTREIIGFEALLRWQRPDHGLVSPAAFIPLLEDTGLIIPVGEWVIRAACEFLQRRKQQGLPPLSVSVNLSARQLQHDSLPYTVNGILRETGIEPWQLELEITESTLMQNTEQAVGLLTILKKRGLMISIDDFGTGYSSLSYLKRLPVHTLKIDRSFVKDVTEDADDAAIVRAIITMAQQLGLDIIAEGVETEAQRQFLIASGCAKAQGYLFGMPMSESDIGQGRLIGPA